MQLSRPPYPTGAGRCQTKRSAEELTDYLLDVGINVRFDVTETLRELEEEMLTAANNLEFEKAALLRDQIKELKRQFGLGSVPAKASGTNAGATVSYRKGRKRP